MVDCELLIVNWIISKTYAVELNRIGFVEQFAKLFYVSP